MKLLRKLTLVGFLSSLIVSGAQAEEVPKRNKGPMGDFTLRGRIVELNQEFRFAIVNLGSVDGAKKGMIFTVFQRDEEAAKIKVKKVRRHISACDIQLVYTGRGIGVGDLVIYKEPVPILKLLKPLESTRMIEVEPIVVDIDAPKQVILRKALGVFEEFDVMVTDTDPTKYYLKGHKTIEAPLTVSLLTEWGPYVRDKTYYTAEISSTPRFNRLVIRLRGVYDREGQLYNHDIDKGSSTYKEAQEIAFSIKDLSERL